MTFTPTYSFTDGTFSDADEVNIDFVQVANQLTGSIYTGTAFNSVRITTDGDGTTTNNTTIQLSTAQLLSYNYLEINVSYLASTSATKNTGASCSGQAKLKVERNETGQASWSTLLDSVVSQADGTHAGATSSNSVTSTIKLIVTLTAGEKTNGIDIKFTSSSITVRGTDGSGVAAFTNIQMWFTKLW